MWIYFIIQRILKIADSIQVVEITKQKANSFMDYKKITHLIKYSITNQKSEIILDFNIVYHFHKTITSLFSLKFQQMRIRSVFVKLNNLLQSKTCPFFSFVFYYEL